MIRASRSVRVALARVCQFGRQTESPSSASIRATGISELSVGLFEVVVVMRVPLSFITGTSSVSSPGRPAELGSVGPHTLDVLGFAPEEHRLYVLEHYDDESGDLPQLHFMHTRGHHMGRLVPVRSWYEGELAQVEGEFEGRLSVLLTRLRPMRPLPISTLSLRTRVVKRRALRLYPDRPPIRKFELRLTVRPGDVDLVASLGGHALVTAYLRPRAHLVEAFRIPGERLAVAVVSYVGIPFEVGYEKQAALLVPLP